MLRTLQRIHVYVCSYISLGGKGPGVEHRSHPIPAAGTDLERKIASKPVRPAPRERSTSVPPSIDWIILDSHEVISIIHLFIFYHQFNNRTHPTLLHSHTKKGEGYGYVQCMNIWDLMTWFSSKFDVKPSSFVGSSNGHPACRVSSSAGESGRCGAVSCRVRSGSTGSSKTRYGEVLVIGKFSLLCQFLFFLFFVSVAKKHGKHNKSIHWDRRRWLLMSGVILLRSLHIELLL